MSKLSYLKARKNRLLQQYEESGKKQIKYKINTIERQIAEEELKEKPYLSDHAIVRYLERVQNVDIKQIKSSIITPEIREMVEKLGGTGEFPNGDFKVVIKDYVVLTIIPI